MGDTSATLLAALAQRHSDAVFVPECKNGPTQTGSHRRLDAWVLLKTWSPVTAIGYEIKVSRADWRRDEKLDEYAGLCHLLYIVAPKGVVPLEEVPAGIGLLEPAGDKGRLVTRRKPTRREIEMPVALLVYVLMCRAKITTERAEFGDREWKLRSLRIWAEGKNERRELHHLISGRIREQFDAQEDELHRLTSKLERLERVERTIRDLGFDPDEPCTEWKAEKRIREMSRVIDPWLPRELTKTSKSLESIAAALEALRAPAAPGGDRAVELEA